MAIARFPIVSIGAIMVGLRAARDAIGEAKGTTMSDRIVLRIREALVEADVAYLAAAPEVVIGEQDGPVGSAVANLIGEQEKGYPRAFAILDSEVQVRPATCPKKKVDHLAIIDSIWLDPAMTVDSLDHAELF